MKKIFAIALLGSMLFNACSKGNNMFRLQLNKTKDKDFVILQLTDVHIIDVDSQPYPGRLTPEETEKFKDQEKNAYRYIDELITKTKPDYIVFTGDTIYGEFDPHGDNFKNFVNKIEGYKIPWSFIFGNHDGEYFSVDKTGKTYENTGIGMENQCKYLLENTKYCLFEQGSEDMGFGNYTVHLVRENKLFYTFSFLDTHGCRGYQSQGINSSQCSWYRDEMEATKQYKVGEDPIPNLMFAHIPFKQFLFGGQEQYGFDNDGKGVITEDYSVNSAGDYGVNSEKIMWCNESRLWNDMKVLGNTKGIFVGHDHVNNSSLLYDGVRLTFGMKSTIFDYHDKVGGTLISIKDDKSFSVKPIFSEYKE